MKWDRQRAVTLSFIVLSLGSAVYLSVITLNYLNYYPGISQLSAQIDSVSIVQGSNYSRIDTRITVSNPSDYSGFTVAEADSLTFLDSQTSSATLFTGTGLIQENLVINKSIGPHSIFDTDVPTNLSPSQAGDLAAFEKSQNGNVMANMTLTIQVFTFLAGPAGPVKVVANSNLPLKNS